jgi:hypothetical protein
VIRAICLSAVLIAAAAVVHAQDPPPEFLPAVPDEPRPPERPSLPEGLLPKPTAVPELPPDYVAPTPAVETVVAPAARYWFTADLLQWWTKGDQPPPLISSSRTGIISNIGVLGSPGTEILFGGDTINTDTRTGYRLGLGMWLDDARRHGLGFTYTSVMPAVTHFNSLSLAGMGGPLSGTVPFPVPLARPYFNAQTGSQEAVNVGLAVPFASTAVVTAEAHSDFLAGEFNYTYAVTDGPNLRLSLLAGYRMLYLHENLLLTQTGSVLSSSLPQVPAGGGSVADVYGTKNYFHGGQVGVVTSVGPAGARWTADLALKGALGYTFSDSSAGGTIVQAGGANLAYGLYTGPGNSFNRRTTALTFAPELDLNVTWRVTDCVRVFAGYSVLYWDEVRRPGGLVNVVVNPVATSVAAPGPATFTGTTTDFFAQGLNFGFEIRY